MIGVILVPILLVQPWRTYNNQGPIRSDGLGYFAWTRAALDGELGFCRYPSIVEVAAIKIPRPTKADPHRIRCANKYPPGLAMLQFPVMAALSSRANDSVAVTPAQHEASLWLGGLALVGVCIAITAIARRLGASGWGVQIAVIAFAFGAGLFPYATYSASFVHIHVALLVSLMMWAAVRTHQQGRSLGTATLAGLCAFFIVAMRNIDLAIIAVLGGAYLIWTFRARTGDAVARLRGIALDLAPVAIGVVGAAALQLGLNHYMSGHWALSSYRSGEDFVFDQPHQREVLFSYSRGLFVYAPVAFLTLCTGLVVRRARNAAMVYGALILVLTMIYGFWYQWELGGGAGFGNRGFVDIAPVGMLAAAMVVTSIRRPARVAFSIVALGAALWTMQLAALMATYNYPEYTADAHVYWSHTVGSESVIARLFRE
ncbi:MAG: hypothetical protein ABJC79_13870 [Acidimicrobiia bacterium]